MPISNRIVARVLRSPLHRVLSGSTCLVRYRGRRTGTEIVTPTQYARVGEDVVILAGRPETKRWWRNFHDDRDLDLLIDGTWHPMRARAILGSEEPEVARPLLQGYLARFPKAARTLGVDADTPDEEMAQVRAAVMVRCRPR